MGTTNLSLEILSLVVGNLKDDKQTLSACTLVSRVFSQVASPLLLRRCTYVIDPESVRPITVLIDALESSHRLRSIEHLVLMRREKEHDPLTLQRRTPPPKRIRKESTPGKAKLSEPIAPPPDGHMRLIHLHRILSRLPHLCSLTITRLHIVPGAPFPALLDTEPEKRPVLPHLHFRGIDTANAFHALLALFSRIGTLTVSNQWNYCVVPTGSVRLPDAFPYNLAPGQRGLSIGTLRIEDCMPRVVAYWFKACRALMHPNAAPGDENGARGIERVVLDDSMLMFEVERDAFNSALGEMWEGVRRVDMDISSKRPIFSAAQADRLFPALSRLTSLHSIHLTICEGKECFTAAERFILSTKPRNSLPPQLRELHFTIVFPPITDYFGDPETPEAIVKRIKRKRWVIFDRLVRMLEWDKASAEEGEGKERFITVRLLNASVKKGGKETLTDVLTEVLTAAATKRVLPFLRIGCA